MEHTFHAGAASVDITPTDSQFLFGYPHVKRYSTGVHDPLMSSALYLSDGNTELLLIANDIIFIPKDLAARLRPRIERATGVPAGNIMLTATHTHSGPITVDYISCREDPAVPPLDANYLRRMEDGILAAAVEARGSGGPAEIALVRANSTGIGTNRRDPNGPSDHDVPVFIVRSASDKDHIAAMLVCSMHPTVLHEDSTLVSADFPGMAREYLQKNVFAKSCPILHHTGPAGNQSPRHVTRGNSFEEAKRLGEILGRAVQEAAKAPEFRSQIVLASRQEFIELPRRSFPPVADAAAKLEAATARLQHLRETGAPREEVRTAECDWFGAEETLTLANAAADGSVAATQNATMPAEVQVFTVGPWTLVGWAGEIFVDYALGIKDRRADTFVISLANGELQGYIVTPDAAAEGGYEASNALFAPSSGQALVDKTLEMLEAR